MSRTTGGVTPGPVVVTSPELSVPTGSVQSAVPFMLSSPDGNSKSLGQTISGGNGSVVQKTGGIHVNSTLF